MSIELHIEELVLKGIGGGKQHEIQASMERELVQLLRAENIGASSLSGPRELSRLDLGSFSVRPNANAQAIGRQLAQSVFRGIQR